MVGTLFTGLFMTFRRVAEILKPAVLDPSEYFLRTDGLRERENVRWFSNHLRRRGVSGAAAPPGMPPMGPGRPQMSFDTSTLPLYDMIVGGIQILFWIFHGYRLV